MIDDEAVILQGLKKLLNWEQLDIEMTGEAMDGEQGLRLIAREQPDIVISDIAMPNLTGIELLKKIKEHNWGVKVIFLSGYQEFSYAREAVRYGAVDYLLKPVGEKVAFGTITQLVLENIPSGELEDIITWCIELGLPVTLKELGVAEATDEKIMAVATAACAETDTLHNMPFEVTPETVCAAIKAADAYGHYYLGD